MKSYKSLVVAAFAAALVLPLSLSAQEKKKGFAAADKNSDGFLSVEEYVAAFKGKGTEDEAKKRFEKLDANKDGKLTAEELAAGRKGDGKKKEKKD